MRLQANKTTTYLRGGKELHRVVAAGRVLALVPGGHDWSRVQAGKDGHALVRLEEEGEND